MTVSCPPVLALTSPELSSSCCICTITFPGTEDSQAGSDSNNDRSRFLHLLLLKISPLLFLLLNCGFLFYRYYVIVFQEIFFLFLFSVVLPVTFDVTKPGVFSAFLTFRDILHIKKYHPIQLCSNLFNRDVK